MPIPDRPNEPLDGGLTEELDGDASLSDVLWEAQRRGFTRRPRMKPGLGFDLLGPDGRVAIYGFNERFTSASSQEKARHILIIIRTWQWP